MNLRKNGIANGGLVVAGVIKSSGEEVSHLDVHDMNIRILLLLKALSCLLIASGSTLTAFAQWRASAGAGRVGAIDIYPLNPDSIYAYGSELVLSTDNGD